MGDGNRKEGGRDGLSRGRLVEVALELVQNEGLQALTMRGLAERLFVKPASLYWHVRDRGELVELLAAALMDEVRLPRPSGAWRADALAVCMALDRVVSRRRDAARILLEVPEAVERSDGHARLRGLLETGGLAAAPAREAATMMLVHVLVGSIRGIPMSASGGRADRQPRLVAIDSGSRGVTLRAGAEMAGLVRAAHDPSGPAPALVRGDRVTVRRLRGSGQGELEINPDHPWRFKVQAPTWNTLLDLRRIDVREIHIDSGATRVECILPAPHGVVPIEVSSGVVGVRLRRPPGVKLVADVSTAAVQLRLDEFSVAASARDIHWESAGPPSPDRYSVSISSGAVRVSIEQDPSLDDDATGRGEETVAEGGVAAALGVVLDGVDRRRGVR